MPAKAYSCPLQVFPGIPADKLGLLLPLAPQTPEQIAYFENAAREQARYEAECARVEEENAALLWEWLGSRDAALASEDFSRSSVFQMTMVIVGKTREAVEDLMAQYMAKYSGTMFCTQFQNVEPWHKGFRVTGSRGMQ